jgi:hypothetical protein
VKLVLTDNARTSLRRGRAAFTLIEVILATAILFMCMFAILGVLSAGVHGAGIIKRNENRPTAGMVAATMTMSNKLEAGYDSGTFGDFYPDYSWQRQIQLYSTNGLYQIDISVFHNGDAISSLSMLLYRPDSGGGPLRTGNR